MASLIVKDSFLLLTALIKSSTSNNNVSEIAKPVWDCVINIAL